MGGAWLLRIVGTLLAAALLPIANVTDAATIWTGPPITFSKLRTDDATQAAHQDRMTPQIWLTRGPTRGLFNIKREDAYVGGSPADTEWAFGTTADLPNLRFTSWVTWHQRCPPCAVGRNAVLHLISEDIYIDIKILSWPSGQGSVIYQRSTPSDSPVPAVEAIEFFHSDFNHYFITSFADEAAKLDATKAPGGWMRTGQSWYVYPGAVPGMVPTCRFFSAAFAPKSSHFYSADAAECAQVRTMSAWQYEGDAFYVNQTAGGNCPTGTAPLYRLYNAGEGGAPNHRYTTCTNIRDRMLSKGWMSEGIGMCVASGSNNCIVDLSFGAVPEAPGNVVATPGNTSVTLTFNAPTDGGLPITSYTATCGSAGLSRTGTNTMSPITVRGVPNGVRQACIVYASNDVGNGPPSATVLVTPGATTNIAYNPLWIPPLLSPTLVDGTLTYEVALAPSSKQFLPGAATATYSYNGNGFWGPTLVMNKGQTVRMSMRNDLAEATTTHWHGLLLPGAADGGPHSIIPAGTTWVTQVFPVKNNAATYWYHPHRHENTQRQLTLGAAGFIILRDAEEAALALPRTYGVDDIPLALTSRRFTTIDGVANQLQQSPSVYGDVMLTNGTINADITLPRQFVRLRILNAEVQREYNLGFSDGRTFHVIGNDGGLLSAPVPVTHLLVAPGERYEVLVNLGNDTVGNSVDLESHSGPDSGLSPGFAGYENASSGDAGSLLNYRTFTVLHINVGAATVTRVTTLPAKLAENAGLAALTLDRATEARQIAITGGGTDGPFTFSDLPFDMGRIDQDVPVGSTEAWTVGAGAVFSHSFHIHGVQFRIVSRNGNPAEVKPWEQGWKDTFYLPIRENVTFVVKFDETADVVYPFMYHCHMLSHEDEGLMGQFVVR